jgi:hypothetical protein
MKNGILTILALIVMVAILAPSILDSAVADLQTSCENGTTNANLCRVITGLFAADPTPASVADSYATQ